MRGKKAVAELLKRDLIFESIDPLDPLAPKVEKSIGFSEKVTVFLAVYNGGRFLAAQLESLAAQTIAEIDIIASDDGSQDNSIAILQSAAKQWEKGRFNILKGPGQGFAENFRSLILQPNNDSQYFAFCDQDDFWCPDKLATAIAWLRQQPPSIPALYCGRTSTITEEGTPIGCSPLFSKEPSFQNALVQSIAGGNTMVMNRAAWTLVRESCRRASFVSHDWWSYLIVTGAGGTVHYSPRPQIGYRQHGCNLVGANNSWPARIRRLARLIGGRFMSWNETNIASLMACRDLLQPEARLILGEFQTIRSAPLLQRLSALYRSNLYRQTRLGQLGLWLACLLRRL